MFSSPVLSGCFVVLAIAASTTLAYPAETKIQPIVKVITVDDVSKLKDLPSGAKLVPLSKSRDTKGYLLYTLGQLGPNDVLIAQGTDSYQWDSPQNVQLTIGIPDAGEGVKISYVQMLVNQSSNDGQAYVVDGGIGLSTITIIIEAYNTVVLEHLTEIYGRL